MKVKDIIARLSTCEDPESEVFLQKDDNSASLPIKIIAINNVKKRVRFIAEELPPWRPIKF